MTIGPVPVDASGLLRLLAAGVSLEDAAARRRADPRHAGSTDMTSDLELASRLVREDGLRPPAWSMFIRQHPEAAVDCASWPQAAEAALGSLVSSRPAPPQDHMRLGLLYAAALLDQERISHVLSRLGAASAPLHTSLPGADRARLDDYLLYAGMPSGRAYTVDGLLQDWTKLTETIEADDENLLHEEHVDWLARRDHLETSFSLVSPRARPILEAPLRELDARFDEATEPYDTSVSVRDPWRPQGWWWFRVPRTMGLYFEEKLRLEAKRAAATA